MYAMLPARYLGQFLVIIDEGPGVRVEWSGVRTSRGDRRVTVNSKNPITGDTALHGACRHARWPVVSWLVAAGADPEVRALKKKK